MELAVASGLKVLHTMLEDDRKAICEPRYRHQATRAASRAWTVSSEVVLGGRKSKLADQTSWRTVKKSHRRRSAYSPTAFR